jgi:flagellar motor switch protein FliM
MNTNNGKLSADELQALQIASYQDSDDYQVIKHDLASEDTSLGFNESAIDMINERFTRQLRVGLMDVLRTTPKINIERVKIEKYGSYLSQLQAPLSVNTVKFEPLRGYSLIVIDPVVIFSSLDNFFGGMGKGNTPLHPGRMFTPTETSIIRIMLNIIFGSLKDAWSPIISLDFVETAAEINPQFAQIADENDLVIISRFVLSLDANTEGVISIVTPFISLKPIRDLLRSRIQTSEDNDVKDHQWREELRDACGHAKLQLVVNLAQIPSTIRELQEFEVGDIIYFNKPEYASAEIAGSRVFSADVGSVANNAAIQIIDFVQIPTTKQ